MVPLLLSITLPSRTSIPPTSTLDFAAPTIRDSTFTLGDDGRGYDGLLPVRAYEAGAGILSALTITGSTFTGNTSSVW